MNKFIFTLIFLTAILTSLAQQDAQYTQYMYNTMVVNPAYAGTGESLKLGVLYRTQWLGMDGAPTTQTFTMDTPVSSRIGFGVSIVNDDIGNGTNQDTYISTLGSYALPLTDKAKLSFGLKVGCQYLSVDFNKLRNYSPETSNGSIMDKYNNLSINLGSGLYYYNRRFYFGVSTPNFLKVKQFDNQSKVITEHTNWYLISGYVFSLNSDIDIKPAILFKAVSGAPLQADISATLLVFNKFSIGSSYRWNSALSTLTAFQWNHNVMIGFAYDTEMTQLGSNRFDKGSLEVFLRYNFRKQILNGRANRFF